MNIITSNQLLNSLRLRFQFFPSHLVERSIWPIFLSFTLFSLAISAVEYMHGYSTGVILLRASFVLTIMGMLLWWKDVIIEATFLGDHTKKVRDGILQGFILFVISEVMVFLSVFWAYAHSSLSPAVEIGGVWPPAGITPLDAFAIPFINTLILLSSGAYITWGHHALICNNRKALLTGTFITIFLALIFTFFQYVEYTSSGFTFADSVYGTVFYATTGLHGLHVLVGTLFIVVQYLRIINYHVTTSHHLGHESAILYWHFVDVVWLLLFGVVYY